MQGLLALRGCPADRVVVRLSLPGGGSEAEPGDEPPDGANQIAPSGTGQRLVAEVVITVDVLVVQ